MDMETIRLNNGVTMPKIGYGVFQVTPSEAERCVCDALDAGYRMIDTAQAYGNEEGVGAAIKKSDVRREDIFLVDKIWMSNYEGANAAQSIDDSLCKLDTEYIDLMLLHQPFGDRYNAYRALQDALQAGKVRAIGVSNFYPDHLIDLCHFMDIIPAVNQVETHVFTQQIEARKYMDDLGVRHMSWGPLAEGRNGLFDNETLSSIGKKYNKTAAQVALRYLALRDVIVIPKSIRRERMGQNINIFDFELSDSDMNEIVKLDTKEPVIMASHHHPETVKMFMGFVPR